MVWLLRRRAAFGGGYAAKIWAWGDALWRP